MLPSHFMLPCVKNHILLMTLIEGKFLIFSPPAFFLTSLNSFSTVLSNLNPRRQSQTKKIPALKMIPVQTKFPHPVVVWQKPFALHPKENTEKYQKIQKYKKNVLKIYKILKEKHEKENKQKRIKKLQNSTLQQQQNNLKSATL